MTPLQPGTQLGPYEIVARGGRGKTGRAFRYAIVSESELAEGVAKLAALHKASNKNAGFSQVVAFPEKALDKVRTMLLHFRLFAQVFV